MMAPANRLVGRISLVALCLAAIAVIAAPRVNMDLRPGSVVGQSLGIVAAVLMLGSISYVLVRRSNSERSKPRAQLLHSLIGSVGVATAVVHSHVYLREWSAWVVLAAIGLLATGLYGRLLSPQRVGRAFGRKALPFMSAADGFAHLELDDLMKKKQALAAAFGNEQLPERQFVLRLHHWRRHPLLAYRYQGLAAQERRQIARHPLCSTASASLPERWWRRAHLFLAVLFVVGVLTHVVTTVFFAGYVADGREIYWWHLTDW